MTNKNMSCRKYAELSLVLHLLLLRSADGRGICTKLKYGAPEDDYMPVLINYCCPGYEEINNNQCQPSCDMGCPPNSQCVMPNVCECNAGYEIDESFLYYGLNAAKSCKLKDYVIYLIGMAICCLSVLVIAILGVVLIKYLQKRQQKEIYQNMQLQSM